MAIMVFDAIKKLGELKVWQMLIIYPAIIGILGSSIASGYKFVYYDVLGNPNFSAIEKRNLEEFHKHWGEEPVKRETLDVNESQVEVAYYKSDSCMLVTRKGKNGSMSMIWLPLAKDKLVTYTDASEFFSPNVAHAEMVPMSVHDGDMRFYDIMIGWISPYELMMERRFKDRCVGRFQIYAPTGETCCWTWIRYRH